MKARFGSTETQHADHRRARYAAGRDAVDGMFGGRGDCETSLRERCPGSIRLRRVVVLTEEMQ
jgi:hypothetical protein